MATIKISNFFELEMEPYIQGDTFLLTLEFYEDDNFTIPEDVSDMQWFMDIKPFENCRRTLDDVETLSIDNGIEYGVASNEIIFRKVLTSPPGLLEQSIRSVAGDLVRTRERGNITITKKV